MLSARGGSQLQRRQPGGHIHKGERQCGDDLYGLLQLRRALILTIYAKKCGLSQLRYLLAEGVHHGLETTHGIHSNCHHSGMRCETRLGKAVHKLEPAPLRVLCRSRMALLLPCCSGMYMI